MREQVKTQNEFVSFIFGNHKVDIHPSSDGIMYDADVYRLLGEDDEGRDYAYVDTLVASNSYHVAEMSRQFILNKLTL
tara:strand:- start:276 stop:509 length:234 start_codon:yes stop_codon:yes gene_type:complete